MPENLLELPPQSANKQVAIAKRASFLHLIRDPLRFFREVGEQSPIAEIRLTLRNFYLISDPDMIRELLMTRHDQFEKFPRIDSREGLFGEGLLTSEGLVHRAQRRMLQPGFHRDRLKAYAAQMVSSTEHAMRSWQSGKPIDVTETMNELALDIVTRTLFSLDNLVLAREMADQVTTILNQVNQLVMPWGKLLLRLPLASSRRYQTARRRLNEIVYSLFQGNHDPTGDDLLAMLLSATDPDTGKPLTDVEIRDQIVTMIVAGHETVATGLGWCLYLLACHPEQQNRIAASIDRIAEGGPLTFENFPLFTEVEHVFSESMRLYPPIWILGRRALENYSFGDFQAAKGSVFLVCMANLHRSARWFDAPDEFRPERWKNQTWPNYVYMPFGGGVRRCIGERYAWMEAILCLSAMLREWHFELADSVPPKPLPKLTLRPKHSIKLIVRKRN